MSRYKDKLGLALVCLGVLLLAVSFAFGLTVHDWILVVSLLLIIIGVIVYVWMLKRQSKY